MDWRRTVSLPVAAAAARFLQEQQRAKGVCFICEAATKQGSTETQTQTHKWEKSELWKCHKKTALSEKLVLNLAHNYKTK